MLKTPTKAVGTLVALTVVAMLAAAPQAAAFSSSPVLADPGACLTGWKPAPVVVESGSAVTWIHLDPLCGQHFPGNTDFFSGTECFARPFNLGEEVSVVFTYDAASELLSADGVPCDGASYAPLSADVPAQSTPAGTIGGTSVSVGARLPYVCHEHPLTMIGEIIVILDTPL